jgi:hypothetical protein
MDSIDFLKVFTLYKLEGLLAGGLAWGVIARGAARALGVKALRAVKARGGAVGARGVAALRIIALGIVALEVIARAGVVVDLNCNCVIGVKSMLNRAIAWVKNVIKY